MRTDFSDFAFIDVAIGGVQNRNNVKRFDQIEIPVGAVDAYSTLFCFDKHYQELYQKTKSVRGANQFECYSDWCWFDIDSPVLGDAIIDAQALCRGLQTLGVLKHTVIFFSGKKGFHIGIPSRLFDLKPNVEFPAQMKTICQGIAGSFGIEIDTSIYNSNRLWRLPDSEHSKTGYYKTPLPTDKFLQMSESDIIKLAKKQRSTAPAYVLAPKVKPLAELCEFVKSLSSDKAVKRNTDWELPVISERMLRVKRKALEFLLTQGVGQGNRDNATLLRASESRKIGTSKSDCLEQIQKWNIKNSPPLDDNDLTRIVDSAFTGAGYDFGTGTPALAKAREYAKRQTQEIDVARLLSDKNDDEQYERRPRTFAELKVEGFSMEMPELVGEFCSWRGRITLLAGREKTSGKSTLCTFEAIAALKKGYRVLWVSHDEPREDTCYRFQKAGAENFAENLIIASDMDAPLSLTELITYIKDTKPDLLILDSIHSLIPLINEGKMPDSSQTAEWQQFINRLRPAATLLEIAVIWIHHVNKATGTAMGSIGITAGVDAIVTLIPIGTSSRRKLTFEGRRTSTNMNCILEYLGESEGYMRFDWEDDVDKKLSAPIQNPCDMVVKWLLEYLGDSLEPVESLTIKQDFERAFPDVSERTLERAKTKIGVRIIRKSGKDHGTLWALPISKKDEDDDGY